MGEAEMLVEAQSRQPELWVVDLGKVDPAVSAEFLGSLASNRVPHKPLPSFLTDAMGRLVMAGAETDRAQDFLTKQQFIDGVGPEKEDEHIGRTVGAIWSKLVRRREWAYWMLEHRPAQAEGKPAITLLTGFFTEVPSDDGPELHLDTMAAYIYLQIIPPDDSEIKLGTIRRNRLFRFLRSRHDPLYTGTENRSH